MAEPDRVIISAAEYKRLKTADEACWSMLLAMWIGGLERVPLYARRFIADGGLERWEELTRPVPAERVQS